MTAGMEKDHVLAFILATRNCASAVQRSRRTANRSTCRWEREARSSEHCREMGTTPVDIATADISAATKLMKLVDNWS